MGLKQGVDSVSTDEGEALAEGEYQKQAALLQKRNKAYNDFCEENGLKRKSERITIAKWDRAQAAKARAAAKRREKNLQFIEQEATIKSTSGFPKKVNRPDAEIAHTVNVDLPFINGIVPKGFSAVEVYPMAGNGTCTPIRDLRRLYETYPTYGDASGWEKKSGTVYENITAMLCIGMKTKAVFQKQKSN